MMMKIPRARMMEIVRTVEPLFNEVHRRRRERDGGRTVTTIGHGGNDDDLFEELLNEPPDMEPVWAYLRTLTEDEVYALKALMYKGRDGGDPSPLRSDKEQMILEVTEKQQFVEYVQAALSGTRWKPTGRARPFRQ